MKVFLTGATGFIGSHVARVLVRHGCEVSALVLPGADTGRIADLLPSLRLVAGDLMADGQRLEAELASIRPELCLHLAWYAVPGKYLTAPENLLHLTAGLRLYELLPRIGCRRFVGAGTCFEYETDAGTLSEETPTRPQTLYAACKYALGSVGAQWSPLANMSVAWARVFYLYGPGEDARRLVPHIIGKLTAGEPCLLTSGQQIRDYLHVEDVAEAFWAIARSSLEGPVNIGSSQPVAVAELAAQLGDIVGRADLLRLGALSTPPGDPPYICAVTERLRSTGWRPHHGLRDGLAQTVAWWKR